MGALWKNLVDDPAKAVEAHFDAILAESLINMGAREPRVRAACALAVTDLLSARTFEQVNRHLQSLWYMAFRVLDDTQDAVRQAGLGLASSCMNLTVRLCDPVYTSRTIVAKT